MFGQQSNYNQIKNNLFSGNSNENQMTYQNFGNSNASHLNKGYDPLKYNQMSKVSSNNQNVPTHFSSTQKVNDIFGSNQNKIFAGNTLITQNKPSGKNIFANPSTNAVSDSNMMEDRNDNQRNIFSKNIPNKSQQSGRDLFQKTGNNNQSIFNKSVGNNVIHQNNTITSNIFTSSTSISSRNDQTGFNANNIFGSNNLLLNQATPINLNNQIDVFGNKNQGLNMNNDLTMEVWEYKNEVEKRFDMNVNEDSTASIKQTDMNMISQQNNKIPLTLDQFEDEIRNEYNIIKII